MKGAHFLFAVRLEGFLDESEQVLLVHGGGSVDVGVHLFEIGCNSKFPSFHKQRCCGLVEFCSMSTYLSHIVEIPMGDCLLLSQLSDLVEHCVQLEECFQVQESLEMLPGILS